VQVDVDLGASTDMAAGVLYLAVSLDINYDNPVAQNDPLLIPSFTETDVFISQTLKEKVAIFLIMYIYLMSSVALDG
jgi:hypothetical protein